MAALVAQFLDGGNVDDATCNLYEPGVVHAVQFSRHVESAFTYFGGQSFHLDVESLCANGPLTVGDKETNDFRVDIFWFWVPRQSCYALSLGADDVEQVEAEYLVLLRQTQNFRLAEPDKVTGRQGHHGEAISLCKSENALRLYHGGGMNGFGEAVTVVVGPAGGANGAVDKNINAVADVALADDGFAAPESHEAELRLRDNVGNVAAAHSQEQGQR